MKAKGFRWPILLLGCVFILSCAAGVKTLKNPTGDKSYLIIGSILVQSNYLSYKAEVCRKEVEVAILGKIEENGQAKMTGYWTMTDQNGYFFVPDAPPGQYTVKGNRLTLSDGTRLIISSPLRLPGSTGFHLQDTEGIVFEGDYFPHESKGRIMNLKHNYFTIDRTLQIGHTTQEAVQGLELVTGETLDLPPVQDYFIKKFPDSEWGPILKQSL